MTFKGLFMERSYNMITMENKVEFDVPAPKGTASIKIKETNS